MSQTYVVVALPWESHPFFDLTEALSDFESLNFDSLATLQDLNSKSMVKQLCVF